MDTKYVMHVNQTRHLTPFGASTDGYKKRIPMHIVYEFQSL